MNEPRSLTGASQPLHFQIRLSADGRVKGGDGDALERLGVRLDAWIGRPFDGFVGGANFVSVFRLASAGPLDCQLPVEIRPPAGCELLAGPATLCSAVCVGLETIVTFRLMQIRLEKSEPDDDDAQEQWWPRMTG